MPVKFFFLFLSLLTNVFLYINTIIWLLKPATYITSIIKLSLRYAYITIHDSEKDDIIEVK